MDRFWEQFPAYVPAAERRRRGLRAVTARKKKGLPADPVVIHGRVIAGTFWGKAWCDHLERYSDFANRLPRGRTYVRNGSILHLAIAPGKVSAIVQGSDLYTVTVAIAALPKPRWRGIVAACSGEIDSLVELLKGKVSSGVMKVVSDPTSGLFPAPGQIDMSCSCPDSATMCKHVAAALYGIGARLDQKPELLFVLRGVDHLELLAEAAAPSAKRTANVGRKQVTEGDIASVFGIEIDAGNGKGGVRGKRRPGK
jgi:uncharacterized Zn finger protein